jgi:hypothetical protein
VSDPLPSTALAQPFALTASGGFASRVRVTRGSNFSVDVVPTGTKHFRTFLCGSAGGGTSATDPQEFLAYVEGLFNAAVAGWTVRMRADGRVEMTNAAGTFAVPWTAASATGAIVRNLLGYTADIPSTAAGTYVAADYHPTHLLLSGARVGSKGWQPERPMSAYAALDDGTTYGWDSGYVRRSQQFDSHFHPTDATAMAARSSTLTPAHAAKSRWKQPTLAPAPDLAPPWSVEDFLFTCGGYRVGAALGTFQALVAGSASEIDVASVDPESLARASLEPTTAGLAALRNLKGLKLWWYGSETL